MGWLSFTLVTPIHTVPPRATLPYPFSTGGSQDVFDDKRLQVHLYNWDERNGPPRFVVLGRKHNTYGGGGWGGGGGESTSITHRVRGLYWSGTPSVC